MALSRELYGRRQSSFSISCGNVAPVEGQTLNGGGPFAPFWRAQVGRGPGRARRPCCGVVLALGGRVAAGRRPITGFLGGPAVLANNGGPILGVTTPVPISIDPGLVTQKGHPTDGVLARVRDPRRGPEGRRGLTGRALQHQCLPDLLAVSASALVHLLVGRGPPRRPEDGPPHSHRSPPFLGPLGDGPAFSSLTLVEKFAEGGWMTVVIYRRSDRLLPAQPRALCGRQKRKIPPRQTRRWAWIALSRSFLIRRRSIPPRPYRGVFVVGSSRSGGVLCVGVGCGENFQVEFRNCIFMKRPHRRCAHLWRRRKILERIRNSRAGRGTSLLCSVLPPTTASPPRWLPRLRQPTRSKELTNLAEKIYREFPHSIFFTSKLIFETG